MELTIGFSPCPNDTFIFDALVNKNIDTEGLSFNYILEDVETLNRWAAEGKLDITKLSYNAFLNVTNEYALLHSGSALGKGVGPLLVTRENLSLDNISEFKIAIPGKNTTANLLLSVAFPGAKNKAEVLFSEIEDRVLAGEFDAGLVIHESRFTYEAKGLKKLIDLGDWWERNMDAAIPLGGIVIRRTLGKELSEKVDRLIKQSLEYAWKNYPQLTSFVRDNSQEMDEEIIRKHINLYVNEYTSDLGEEGRKAITRLFEKAKENGLTSASAGNIFY
jgi:1,4-dihydroxy-6-naphthoate synthase